MAFLPDSYSMRFRFDLNQAGSTQDVAEFTLWMRTLSGAEYGDDQLASIAEGGTLAATAHLNAAIYGTNVSLRDVVATAYLANGHTLHEQNFVPSTPWVGTASGKCLPWETALAVSLYTYPRGTFVTHGKRRRGRIYLPPMAASVLADNNSGFLDDSLVHTELPRIKAFLAACEKDREGVQVGRLGVFSRVDSDIRYVSQLSLDAKIDSQRRRQNRELAGHIETAYP